MERVTRGDMDSLGILFERHKQAVFGYLYRLLREETLAEDVLVSTFLRVYDSRRSYHIGAKFTTWLYTIAHHLAVDHLKHSAQREIHLSQLPDPPCRDHLNVSADALERQQLAEVVQQAIARLSPDQRAVVLLREYQELSYREIAEVTGASEQAVRVRAHRARQALREMLAYFMETDQK